jgi:hypothetical protein
MVMGYQQLITQSMDVGLDAGETIGKRVEKRTGMLIIVVRMGVGMRRGLRAADGGCQRN